METYSRDNLPKDGWCAFHKVGRTWMVRIDGPFTVITREGPLSCPDGWLATDRQGWPYPVAADEHALIYRAA